MELKWLMIAWATIMVFMFIGMGFDEHTKSQCRQSFSQSTRSVEDINKICK